MKICMEKETNLMDPGPTARKVLAKVLLRRRTSLIYEVEVKVKVSLKLKCLFVYLVVD